MMKEFDNAATPRAISRFNNLKMKFRIS